jgi:hypothetical protein
VEPIDVLRDNSRHPAPFPELDHCIVAPVRNDPGTGSPSLSIDVHLPPLDPEIGACPIAGDMEVVGIDFCPYSFRASEVRNTRLGRDTGAAEHEDLPLVGKNRFCVLEFAQVRLLSMFKFPFYPDDRR